MAYQDHFTCPTELLELSAEPSLDFLPELIPILVNTPCQLKANCIWEFLLINDQQID